MNNPNRRTHYRTKSFTSKHQHLRIHAIQQHQYLQSLQFNKSLYPRYDIFSQNNHNNLIVHIQQNTKQELKPKKQSFFVTKIQQKIKTYENGLKKPYTTKTSFFIRNQEPQINQSRLDPKNNTHFNININESSRDLSHKNSIIVYAQQEDKSLSMEEKLKMMYLGDRITRNGRRKLMSERQTRINF